MDLSLLFNIANIYALPFWLLMVILPKWGITQKIMSSYLPFV
ncbi:MAG: abscisic acid-deficient protein Aba4 family protein, partial [Crocosphaera sp.]